MKIRDNTEVRFPRTDLSDTQWAYLAGIMDGEGSFSIVCGGRRPNKDHKNGYLNRQLIISLGNTNLKLIDWLVETVGGDKYLGYRSKTDKHKMGYLWRLHGKERQKEFIDGVKPYLLLKKEQAEVALEMISTEGKQPEVRAALQVRMRALNRKGKTVETNTPNTSSPEVKIESELS